MTFLRGVNRVNKVWHLNNKYKTEESPVFNLNALGIVNEDEKTFRKTVRFKKGQKDMEL